MKYLISLLTVYNHKNPGSVKKGLRIAIQICDLLDIAHKNNIWYRDHKTVHYCWNFQEKRVYAIDWNISELCDQELTDDQIRFDLVQFSARVLFHILTGRDFEKAIPNGPTTAETVVQAPICYEVEWNYDDKQRLSLGLRALLEKALIGGYPDAVSLKKDLKQHLDLLTDSTSYRVLEETNYE